MTREEKFGKEGLTFDDVLLIPARSDILPTQVSTKTRLTNEISLDIPILSAAMDTVTEARMAIALGRLGGLGVVHRNFSIDDQVAVLAEVKAAGVLAAAAVGVSADADERASALVGAGADVIVVDIAHGHSAGVVRMVEKLKARHRVQVVAGNVVTAEGTEELVAAGADCVKVGVGPGAICTTRVVAGAGMPQITAIFDCAEVADRHGIPVCADGGIQESGDIAKAIGAGASTVMLGGLLAGVVRMVEKLKARHRVQVVAGNVVTAEGTEELVAAGADCVKVGVGPGAICTTRVVAGAGMPQITAIFDCAEVADRHGIPVCADGGIQESGDIAKAIGAGASTVMLGGLLAGVDESPGEVERTPNGPVKRYRGMGSLGAMQARRSRDRYGQAEVGDFSKLVPEGVEGHVTAVGPLAPFVHQLVGGLRAGMKYVGAATIDELRERARFVRISGAGLRESHPHDIRITAEAPNYRVRA